MRKNFKALITESGEDWVGIIDGRLMVSNVPILLPFSVDRKMIETAVESSKVVVIDASEKDELRYRLVVVHLEIHESN
jgi:hypothetical protein